MSATVPSRIQFALTSLLSLTLACAHVPKGGNAESLKKAAEAFHSRARWKDFRGAGELIIPERREAFDKAVTERGDEKNLSISDYDLEEMKLWAEGFEGQVVSKVSWVRFPSVSEQSATVRSQFVYRNGAWWLARQDTGPFADELSAPYEAPAPPSAGK